ncbi:hypothetical protein Patl1_34198 [Pistacia atlantica]|uniref:Uncharacterized protein n=1 Tax=Pistacia atlantica TaxID=434234 RepID=A0ACC0ZRG5_9ROSI|nr:hypothetical protein Patl1_34198 [Pistacia atlantica]
MSSRKQVMIRDLVEEAKKRIVFLAICVVGLSYLMSLTSSSVLVNLPAAASLIILLRNVNSPVVEEAIDTFTRHLVSEWIADLWYSRLTPDKEGPEELVHIINGALGEFSGRMRNINLIDLLTRDLVNLFCTHLELFRASQAKIEKHQSETLTIELRDMEIRRVLAAEDKLHPALFSAEAEHKVLQCLMDGLISLTFRPEDLQCSFFRYTVRELLACAVMRPVLNLASPKFINERIESLAINMSKGRGAAAAQETSQSKANGSPKISSDHFSRTTAVAATTDDRNGTRYSKDPLLSMDTRSSHSWSSLPMNTPPSDLKVIQRFNSGGEWGDMLDHISRRKTQALAPEHFENMWAKGRNYRKKEGENRVIEQVPQHSAAKSVSVDSLKATSNSKGKDSMIKANAPKSHTARDGYADQHVDQKISNCSSVTSYQEHDDSLMPLEGVESGSSSSYTSEDEETDSALGLDSPGTKVWDGKSNRNVAVSHIHHPLENPDGHISKKSGRRQVQYGLPRTQSGQKRFRSSSQKLPVWQEVERTSFLSGDGQDILSSSKGLAKIDESSDDSESEILGRSQSGAAASSSASFISIPESRSSSVTSLQSSLMVDSFFKLRCEVLGANIVKSGSRTFAVYSISVTDANNNCWSIKRRFRHFEELHRRLKFFQEYNLHLPPKHFLSTGFDVPVIRERCKLLDIYLKKLLQLPTVSGSIEVWDFLSVRFAVMHVLLCLMQTYVFSNSFSIVETLSVDLEDKPSEKVSNTAGPVISPSSRREQFGSESRESAWQAKDNFIADGKTRNAKEMSHSPVKTNNKEHGKSFDHSGSGPDNKVLTNSPYLRNLGKIVKGKENDGSEEKSELLDAANDPTLPSEWVPPNLSVPILDLVDVIFQLQDGGWIRRKAFWVAKQVLQLGMGDAFDDWLIEKIQLLRTGSVIASGIKRVEKSSVCLKQLAYDLLELLLLSAFPELDYAFKQLHEEKHKFGEFKY